MEFFVVDFLNSTSDDGDTLSIETEYRFNCEDGTTLIHRTTKLTEAKQVAIAMLRQRRKSILKNIEWIKRYKV